MKISTALSTVTLLFLCHLTTATKGHWPSTSFKTGPWQPPQLQLNKTKNHDIDPGLIFISIRNENPVGTAATIYDNDGQMIYQGPEDAAMNFRVQKLFGEDVITYWSGEVGVFGGYGYGKVHILDKTYREIYTVTLTGDFVSNTGDAHDSWIDVHEHWITEQNTILVSANNVTQHNLTSLGGPVDGWIIDSLFYEIDIATNEVVFAWNALDHEDKIPLSRSRQPLHEYPTQEVPWDPYHLNSIEPVNDGWLVSMRLFCSGFYLNKDGTVRWQLSGNSDDSDFTGEDLSFSYQHDIRAYNETKTSMTLSLFNNANKITHSFGESTGMLFDIDLSSMSGKLLYNLSDPTNAVYGLTQGSFQLLLPQTTPTRTPNLNYFIGYGSSPQMKEYNAKGQVVLSGQFGAPTHAMSYRVLKHQWTATPFWDPAVVVEDGVAYMSWNGATEYDNWAIFEVSSLDSNKTTLLSTHARTGFETSASISDAEVQFVMVAARKGDTVLRFSGAFEV